MSRWPCLASSACCPTSATGRAVRCCRIDRWGGWARFIFFGETHPITLIQAFNVDDGTVTPVPEPVTYGMLLAGLGLLGFILRRSKNQA
ncbi:hypothetical protein CSQ93_06885 [Janthinobacterium sp. BJB426]|uniref:PEP-CTERM sorting domain-containing protein n=1 Tax=Janthinobacterium sp. BJB426 TaxID=2048010 RepID=UPI000C10D83B|nr:PEP-CTERM sorting domain-containing protein [Janthinobacterium sp. BJB426]PHV28879.1 hypothetical protein CSQ93_06885 [Janthinobacterium sp. BJB426]